MARAQRMQDVGRVDVAHLDQIRFPLVVGVAARHTLHGHDLTRRQLDMRRVVMSDGLA